jgi:integrase
MGKRSYEPRVYKRGRVWWAWGYYANGERWLESTQQRDREAALAKAERLTRERAAVDRAEVAPLPLEQALLDVIAARQREAKSAGTIGIYKRAGGHLCRVLGPRADANALTLADLESYIDKRRAEGGRGPKTMRSTIAIELGILKSALKYAAKHSRFRGNLAAIWPREALKGAHVPHERWLTRAEYTAIRDDLARPDYLTGYVFTGARRSELWRITPRNVDLERNTIEIRGTKTKGATRIVPIAAELRPVLVRRMVGLGPDDPIFPPWQEWDALKRSTDRLGLETVSPNDLRRTFCSWLAQAGTPLLVTVKLMGHRSARMVEKVYARFGSDDLQAAIARLPDCSAECSGEGVATEQTQQKTTDVAAAEKGVSLDKLGRSGKKGKTKQTLPGRRKRSTSRRKRR